MAGVDQVGGRQSYEGDHNYSMVAYTILAPTDNEEDDGRGTNIEQGIDFTRDDEITPDGTEPETQSNSVLVEGSAAGLSETAIELINGSTRSSTKTKYGSIIQKWLRYCKAQNCSTQATTTTFVNFLASEFNRDLKYSYLRGYTAALAGYTSAVDNNMVTKLLKGIHNKRPSTAKYSAIWDVNLVLAYIGAMKTETFSDMSLKVAALLMILSGNRVNMLSHMKITQMYLNEDECTFTFDEVLKTTQPGISTSPMTFKSFPTDPFLCPVANIWNYLQRRNELSGESQLLITRVKPFSPAKPDTIANWLKQVLHLAGVNNWSLLGTQLSLFVNECCCIGGSGDKNDIEVSVLEERGRLSEALFTGT